jgi:hypothetical protein
MSMKIVQEPAPSVSVLRSSVPEKLEEVVRRALEKSPQARFASALEMEAALDASCDEADDLQDSSDFLVTPMLGVNVDSTTSSSAYTPVP